MGIVYQLYVVEEQKLEDYLSTIRTLQESRDIEKFISSFASELSEDQIIDIRESLKRWDIEEGWYETDDFSLSSYTHEILEISLRRQCVDMDKSPRDFVRLAYKLPCLMVSKKLFWAPQPDKKLPNWCNAERQGSGIWGCYIPKSPTSLEAHNLFKEVPTTTVLYENVENFLNQRNGILQRLKFFSMLNSG